MSDKQFTDVELDAVAKKMFDFACSTRTDNLAKDGSPGDPRKVSCEYELLWNSPKNFYRNLAKWHLLNT